jgi:hypothetical protein
MITAEHEQAKPSADESFADAVAVDFCDAEHDLFGLVWMTRLPGADRSRASAMIFSNGELVEDLQLEHTRTIESWADARLDGVGMSMATPLERWSIAARGTQASVELDLGALTPPRELIGEELGEMAGIQQYEQLCRLSGTIEYAGRTYPVRCLGRRVHSWGEFAWDRVERWRTLYVASLEGRAISAAGALPSGSDGHEQEVRSACFLDVDEASPFEDVRISTVFSADGFPEKVGLELLRAEDEFPQRMGGEVVCGARARRGDHDILISFFRWSIDGEPAYGSYELVTRL